MSAWQFFEPPGTTVLTQRRVLAGQPVLFVQHDEQGYWYFFDDPKAPYGSCLEPVLVPLERLASLHPGVQELADLPAGWQAWRDSPEQPWEKESQRTLERTLARRQQLSEKMRRESVSLPPGSPSVVEIIREMRGPI